MPTSALDRQKMLTSIQSLSDRVPGSLDQFWKHVHGFALDFEAAVLESVSARLESAGGGAVDRNPHGTGKVKRFRFVSKGELRLPPSKKPC